MTQNQSDGLKKALYWLAGLYATTVITLLSLIYSNVTDRETRNEAATAKNTEAIGKNTASIAAIQTCVSEHEKQIAIINGKIFR